MRHRRMRVAPMRPMVVRVSPRMRKENRAVRTGQIHWMRATVLEEMPSRAAFCSR